MPILNVCAWTSCDKKAIATGSRVVAVDSTLEDRIRECMHTHVNIAYRNRTLADGVSWSDPHLGSTLLTAHAAFVHIDAVA